MTKSYNEKNRITLVIYLTVEDQVFSVAQAQEDVYSGKQWPLDAGHFLLQTISDTFPARKSPIYQVDLYGEVPARQNRSSKIASFDK